MRPPKFAIEAENYITSSLCLYVLRPPKFAIEAENSITSITCDQFAIEAGNTLHHQYTYATS